MMKVKIHKTKPVGELVNGHIWAREAGKPLYAIPVEGEPEHPMRVNIGRVMGKNVDKIEYAEGNVLAYVGRARVYLPAKEETNYREYPPTEGVPLDINVDALKTLLPAAATEEYSAVFRGVQFEPDGTCVATDGFRLHLAKECFTLGDNSPLKRNVVINAKHLKAIYKSQLTWVDHPKWPVFGEAHGVKVYAEALEGVFPDYMRLVATPEKERAELPPIKEWSPVDALTDAKQAGAAFIRWTPSKTILYDSLNGGVGETIGTLDIRSPFDTDVQFDLRYLMEAVAHVGEDAKVFTLNPGEYHVSGFTLESSDSLKYAVVMPMRI